MQENDESKSFIEKRKYPRVPARVRLDCELAQTGTPSVYGLLQFHSRNISSGGIFLEGVKNLPEDYILSIEFKLPENEKLFTVKGLVVWTNDHGSGIRFMTLDINDFETITEYINKSLPSS